MKDISAGRSLYPATSPWPPIACGIAVILLALVLAGVVGAIVDRYPFAIDRTIIEGLRQWAGPAGLRGAAVNLTSLGSVAVLTLVVVGVAGLLFVQRLWLTALTTILACWSGGWAVTLVKSHVARPRPDLVPHWVDVVNTSFPSGHAAGSATVYLTMAALASEVVRGRAARRYILAVAVLLVGAIGVSRVYLGVHWPTDVLAGWCFGTLWALGWWIATAGARRSLARALPETERPNAGG
ncbi:phosphatase PAP2 family protein [Sphingomonas gellani]|uniref:phosphatase PAP2 family protein n=1 Tax=Sphingomonas gellani TaxID=1166340 RepID=UPI001FCD4A54|nr:phosphatase PAP2 family protein [Sphingomonas gellani]